MENNKSKKTPRNSNNSDSGSTPYSTPVLSPIKNDNSTNTDSSPIRKDKLIKKEQEEKQEEEKQEIEKKMEDDEESKDKQPTFEKLTLNLKIISKLKPGYKLSLKESNENDSNIYIDNSYFQYFYRLFSDNSRQTTITFLEKLDNQISIKIENLLNEDNNHMFLNSKENILLNLSHDLTLSLIGLNNLINTYVGDEYTISKIEMIINNFELKIRKITNILKVE